MTWMVGWRNGDDAFLALGPDREQLPVYRVVGAVRDPDSLHASKLLFPSCLKWMPYADPVVDLVEISEAEAEGLEAKIVTRSMLQGLS